MIVDLLLKLLKKDTLFKRNIVKTISWNIIGSLDTIILIWIVTGKLNLGAELGLIEFLTKMLLYYTHERFWQKTRFGLPSKYSKAQIIQKEIKPNLFKQIGKISRRDREQINGNKSFTIWLTGLSGSGKSTLATEIELWVHEMKGRTYILDGDNTRLGINSDLSFTNEDRTENIRRVAELCRLFNDAGVITIASFISPFKADRLMAKTLIGQDNFIEVYIDASISVCQKRDTKGLYKLARAGKISNFTGISSPYEPPVSPDIHLHTDSTTIQECLNTVKEYLILNKEIKLNKSVTAIKVRQEDRDN